MPFFVQDMTGFALASLLAPLLLYLPGYGLVRLFAKVGMTFTPGWPRVGWAMLLGLSLLPVLDVLAIRAVAMPGMLALNLSLAIYGAPMLHDRHRGRTPRGFLALLACWWLISAWSYVDIDVSGRLYQSLIAVDMVKHAAVIEQIARQGVPFSDPFFARSGVAGYYHYFYVWGAAVRWISGFGISAPMAFAATAFWTGPAVIALVWRVMADAALIRPGRDRRVILLAVLLCGVAGVDILFMALRYVAVHRVEPQLDVWNTELRALGTSILWVPHHVASMLAAWTGLLLAIRIAAAENGRVRVLLTIGAGAAFATMFGMSVWIAFTIAPLLMMWTMLRLFRRDGWLFLAGVVAASLSALQFRDMIIGRAATDTFPIAFMVRPFTLFLSDGSLTVQLWSLLLLPLNYAMELGICALGACLYLRLSRRRDQAGAPVRHLLFWSFIVSVLVGSFFESVIINNDLGWRAVLFASMSVLVWTLAVGQSVRKPSALAAVLILLGAVGTIWDLAGLRLYQAKFVDTTKFSLNSHPKVDHALRSAYGWADEHLPEGAVLQHNPGIDPRAVDFGIYGHHWPAVADKFAQLFGASAHDPAARIARLMPLFDQALPRAEMIRRGRAEGVDYMLYTVRDPVWIKAKGPPLMLHCVYRDASVCIAPLSGAARP